MENLVLNFCAGPAKLPLEVLKRIRDEMLNYNGNGYSILEMSHRSTEFTKIMNETEHLLRELLDIPSNYKILFLQGGATGQFAAVPLNLINRNPNKNADYVITGAWSSKAAAEAKKYGNIREVFPRLKSFTQIPDSKSWKLDSEASYIYYCDNETIHGVEFSDVLDTPSHVPIVCDMSSNFLTKQVPVSKFGLIFASAQKNLGCAGNTVVIVRDDLLNHALPETLTILNYKSQSDNNSLYNTPATFPIYTSLLVLQWLKEQGGVKKLAEVSTAKAELLYNVLDESNGFYNCPVTKKDRSRVNVVFRIENSNEELESSFLKFAKSKYNIIEIKGHRSVGGLRISLYNSIPLEYVEKLVQCMSEFKEQFSEKR